MIVAYRSYSFTEIYIIVKNHVVMRITTPYVVGSHFDRISNLPLYLMTYSMAIEWDIGVFNHFLPLYPILSVSIVNDKNG